MAQQQLLLLQILKIPVVVIKFLAKVLSILTYLPNYLILLGVDHVLFSDRYCSSLLIYGVMWLPKVLLLFLSLFLFCSEFYGIFYVMQLQEHGLIIQVTGIVLTLAGLLILMRRGYLSLIEKYNLSKLKSVMQHVQLGYTFFIDLLGLILAVINVVMVVNIRKTLSYDYSSSDVNYRYLRYIFKVVRESVIIYIQFFYIKIFFGCFPWRFEVERETYLKEKEKNNVLNCLVLLTLVYWSTLLDILFFVLFGLFNVVHFKRRIYYQQLNKTHKKWRVTINHFGFAVAHTVQLVLQSLMFPICWKQSKECLKLLMGYGKMSDLFGSEFTSLLLKCAIRLPYFFCNALIFLFRYKYLRRELIVGRFYQSKEKLSSKQYLAKSQLIVEYSTFSCFWEQCTDSVFFLMVPVALLAKPWKWSWTKLIMKEEYEVRRTFIMEYTARCLMDIIFCPIAVLCNIPFIFYNPAKIMGNYRSSLQKITSRYQEQINKVGAQPNGFDETWPFVRKDSHVIELVFQSINNLKHDVPHFPAFFLSKATFLSIYDCSFEPQRVPYLFIKIYREYFRLRVMDCARGEFYSQMHDRMKASGNLKGQQQEAKFWRYAYKCQQCLLIQRILKKFLLKKMIERIDAKIAKGSTLSQISNEYWYQYQLRNAYFLRLIAFVVEIILTVIGFVFLLPLTLWRLPSFIKLYSFHKSKKFFFPILFKMYRQMVVDILTLPVKLVSLVLAPRMFINFVRNTSFRYGPGGIQTFSLYQAVKKRYLMEHIFLWSLIAVLLHCVVSFIYVSWIRIKTLRAYLRSVKLTTSKLYFNYILKSPVVPKVDDMLGIFQNGQYETELGDLLPNIVNIFVQALKDLPYLALISLLFVTMPWRINHILQAIKDTREDTGQRKSFIRLLRNIFKDYACILMNIILLLSVFKTRKALIMIRRNYRLNFFIGFLEYGYFNELIKELHSLGLIYVDMVYLLTACLVGWHRAHLLISDLLVLRKKIKQEQQSAALNQKMFENAKKSGKQLQLLTKMGYYNYMTVCSFLEVKDIMSLRGVDSFNYHMSKREQVWFTKWQTIYGKKHNMLDEDYEVRCRKAYQLEKEGNRKQAVCYHTIIMGHFNMNAYHQNINLAQLVRDKLPLRVYNYIFKDYRYEPHEGYGPENELPQAENEDPQFLRMTNQVRRPLVYLQQNEMYLNWLLFKPVQKVVQKMHRYFRVSQNRRRKQVYLVFMVAAVIVVLLWIAFKFVVSILWLQDSWIGIRFVLLFYLVSLVYLMSFRINRLYLGWIALIPFDLYYDVVRFLRYLKDQIFKKRIYDPTVGCLKAIRRLIIKIYLKCSEKAEQGWQRVKIVGRKCVNFVVQTSKIAYQKILLPLYIRVADAIRRVKNWLVVIFKTVYSFLRALVKGVIDVLTAVFRSIYNGVYAIFSNANKLYYFILKTTMVALLRFGLIGNLLFTFVGLLMMTLPTWIWWFFYSARWYLIVSSIHTMVLIVVGYKHLNRIKAEKV